MIHTLVTPLLTGVVTDISAPSEQRDGVMKIFVFSSPMGNHRSQEICSLWRITEANELQVLFDTSEDNGYSF